MWMYLSLMFLFSMAETVQTSADIVPAQGTTSVEMAIKFCQNTKQATLNFRETMQGFDKVTWTKEMGSFDRECQRGYLKGFDEASTVLPKTVSKNQVDGSIQKVDGLCAKEMKKQKGTGFDPLHFNIGCIMGGQMRIYQRLQPATM